jgi:ADP-ribose pyrophosphatase YjhB (NUDIX family)
MMQGNTAQKSDTPRIAVNDAMEDDLRDGCSTPEEPESYNRIKAPPVCFDISLKQASMSTETLKQWVFPEYSNFPMVGIEDSSTPNLKSSDNVSRAHMFTMPSASASSRASVPVSVISVSSSNNSCGDSYNLSSDETSESKSNNDRLNTDTSNQPPILTRNASERLNAKILLRKTSRQGRSSQRWLSASSVASSNILDASMQSPSPNIETYAGTTATPTSDPVIRLVTGCVPILQSGKIIFVSASRKPAWILPKGGWELDESMEESAMRECYEEAGCIGSLGPALSSIQYETRKAKKRRIENEFLNEKETTLPQPTTSYAKDKTGVGIAADVTNTDIVKDVIVELNESDRRIQSNLVTDHNEGPESKDITGNLNSSAQGALTSETIARIRQLAHNSVGSGHHTDTESMSAGSTLSAMYTHVQMTLFPLYVQKIEDDWPENGRFRKAVDIDEAIKMMEDRPELQSALIEVRDRKLHLVSIAETSADS